MYYIQNITNFQFTLKPSLSLFVLVLCTVVCMHNVHIAHIFIVCNSVICTKSFNILSILYNAHIMLILYTSFCVYSPLNSYFNIHWILKFKYILLLLLCGLQVRRSIEPEYPS